MARKKTMASAGLSMMDLISNALAGVIILFFILAKSKFPSFPPERVCGTLVMEFSFNNRDKNDFSSVYVSYTDIRPEKSNLQCLLDRDGKILFDTAIINFSSCIEQYVKGPRCAYDTTAMNDTINAIPAIRTYQVFGNDTTKHRVILHDPPEGEWVIGLLYNDHTELLSNKRSDFIDIRITWYGVKIPFFDSSTQKKPFKLLAPTSRCYAIMRFNKADEIKPDSMKFFNQSEPH